MTLHIHIEKYFEKVADWATVVLGNSITFMVVLCLIVFWFVNRSFDDPNLQELIRDFIHAITFLSLFIIQKSFNRFSGALHLKINELVVANKSANKLDN